MQQEDRSPLLPRQGNTRPALARLRAVIWIGAAALACASAGTGAVDPTTAEIVDLTHAFAADSVYWPTAPSGFELRRLAWGSTPGGYFYAAGAFCAPEHGGTHLDAPIHFAEGRQTVEEVPLRRLVAPAVVIDVSQAAAADPAYRLSPQDLLVFEREHGDIEAGSIVLLRTGWSRFWPDLEAYLGDDTPGDATKLRFPAFGADAARLLVEARGVAGLGVDSASLDHGPSGDFPVHRIAAARDVFGLENLTNLDQLPARGALLVALPMKIAGGTGAPVRVVAFVP